MTLAPEGFRPGYEEEGLWTQEAVGWLTSSAGRRWSTREYALFEGHRMTFADLAAWVDRVAQDFVARGVRPGDRILAFAPNCLEVAAFQLAAWRIGAIVVPVVPIYREHEMRFILDDCRPTVVLTTSALGDRRPGRELDELSAELGLDLAAKYLIGGDAEGWCAVPTADSAPGTVVDLPDPSPADECCTILYTSGTTSAPKGARLSGRAILSNARTMRLLCGFGTGDVIVTGAPLSHLSGFIAACVLPLTSGCRIVLLRAWKPDEGVRLIDEEKGTFSLGAPVFLQDMVERYEADGAAAYRLDAYMSGGAPTPPALVQRAEAVGITVLRGYGMTETCGPISMSPLESSVQRRSVHEGQVVIGTELEAVDEDRRPLPAGEIGELRVRSPQSMLGYTDDAITASQMDADGWFYTGDVGSVDAEGWVTVAGRIKDIINRGGEKFSAKDIEAAICAHDEIAAAAVVGVPHERMGEAVCAFITLRDAGRWSGQEALIAHLHDLRLAKQKVPVEWHVVDVLPMTASGKVQKHKLVELREQTAARGA
jgi:acyl-CoA synthetase (AMP-forming)/AMP-acid ligase II